MSDKLQTIVKIKGDDGYDILINMANVTHIEKHYNGGYRINFVQGTEKVLSWKEYDRLDKVLQVIADHE